VVLPPTIALVKLKRKRGYLQLSKLIEVNCD
jgi:hypothetical protein